MCAEPEFLAQEIKLVSKASEISKIGVLYKHWKKIHNPTASPLCKHGGFISVEHAVYLAIEDRICQPGIPINSSSKR